MNDLKYRIGVLVGSLRKESLSRRMAAALANLAPSSLQLEIIEIGTLPLYNEDLDTNPPAKEWEIFRSRTKTVDALLFVTPEYNRSVPGVLKNAIDVGSAPHGQSVFQGKPAAIVSLSPGKMGAFGANHHLRQSLVFLNVPTMQQPEAYISHSEELFDDSGKLTKRDTHEFLDVFMGAFANWVETHLREPRV